MSVPVYSHALRILACAGCGAPVEVSVEGGAATCAYCGVQNHVERRAVEPPRPAASSMSEAERHARLREQEKLGEALPASIEALTVDGELPAAHADRAATEWRKARAALVSSPSFALSERLFYLTVLLTPHLEDKPRVQRSLLETGIELLPDEGHRHVLRCVLSRLAARSGDLDAAEAWLAPCNPTSADLSMDTAYRYALATIATVRKDSSKVLGLLGLESGDVPLAARDRMGCELLRIHAVEADNPPKALSQLLKLRGELGSERLRAELDRRAPLVLCPRSQPQLRRVEGALESMSAAMESDKAVRAVQRELAAATPVWGPRWYVRVPAIFALSLLTAVVGGSLMDGRSLPMEIQREVCARACADCVPPIRSRRWSVSAGNGQRRSSTREFCSDPEGRLASMYLPTVYFQGDPWVEAHQVTDESWVARMAFVFVVALPLWVLVSLLLALVSFSGRRRKRSALQRKLARARQGELSVAESSQVQVTFRVSSRDR